jgi:hypothetical protein
MDVTALKARLEARTKLGMTAEQYDRHLADQRKRAIAEALRAGMHGTDADIDAAVARCKELGVA